MSGSTHTFDTTRRAGIARIDASASIAEAVNQARVFESAGVRVIEAGYPAESQAQAENVRAVAAAATTCEVAAMASCDIGEVSAAIEAVRGAVKPAVHVYMSAHEASEPVMRTWVCKRVRKAVSTACAAGVAVQFSIADIEEMERPWRRQCIDVAVEAGATRIGIPVSAAYMVREVAGFVGPRVRVSTYSVIPPPGGAPEPAPSPSRQWQCRVEVAAL